MVPAALKTYLNESFLVGRVGLGLFVFDGASVAHFGRGHLIRPLGHVNHQVVDRGSFLLQIADVTDAPVDFGEQILVTRRHPPLRVGIVAQDAAAGHLFDDEQTNVVHAEVVLEDADGAEPVLVRFEVDFRTDDVPDVAGEK